MEREWKSELKIQSGATACLPPAMMGEAGWDVLLALRHNERYGLSIAKLASLASVPRSVLGQWLNWLEDRRLVVSGRHEFTHVFRAIITRAGNELLDNYLSATSGLQGGPRR